MIEKLKYLEQRTGGEDMVLRIKKIPAQPWEMQDKINELVDAVNKLETMAKNTNTVLKSLVEENNIHEKQIDELQMNVEPHKCEPAENTTISKMENVAENGNFAKIAQDETPRCPFCQQKLHKDSDGYYTCYTDNCGCMKYGGNGASGSESLWLALIRTKDLLEIESSEHELCHTQMLKTTEELERTRKALDVAIDALNKINMRCQNTVRNHLERATIRGELCDISFYARKAIDDIDNLEQITALEQKDVK